MNVMGNTGISIESDNVTLDLNGFTITGAGSNGILTPTAHNDVTVRNGAVADVFIGPGVSL